MLASVLWHKLLSSRLSHLSSESLLPLTGAPSLDSITVLDLYGNGLAKLKGISSLMNLQRLYVSFNELSRLDDVAQMVRHVRCYGEEYSTCCRIGFDDVFRNC